MADHAHRSIRLVIQQPSLPKYRVPVFEAMARRPGIQMKLVYGDMDGLPNVAPGRFAAEHVPMRQYAIAGQILLWHRAQLDYATPRTTDVLLLSWNTRYLSLVPALLRARRHGIPTILWGHGYSKTEAGWRSFPRRKVAELATALLFYNHTAARRYLDRGWAPDRIHVALNSLDQAPIQAARRHWLDRPDALRAFKQEHGLGQGPVVLFVSRLDRDNRLDLLLEAATKLRPRYPGLKIAIIGKGEHDRDLRQQAQSLGLSDQVHFVGAVYEEHELAPWFLSADVFCYPANIGLSILHAFGYGLPVVTSDHLDAQNPEIEALEPGRNGLLYRDANADALAEALSGLFDGAPLRRAMSEHALQTVTERFNVTRMVDGMEQAVRYCASQSRPAPGSRVIG